MQKSDKDMLMWYFLDFMGNGDMIVAHITIKE